MNNFNTLTSAIAHAKNLANMWRLSQVVSRIRDETCETFSVTQRSADNQYPENYLPLTAIYADNEQLGMWPDGDGGFIPKLKGNNDGH